MGTERNQDVEGTGRGNTLDPQQCAALASVFKDLLIARRQSYWKVIFGVYSAGGLIAYYFLSREEPPPLVECGVVAGGLLLAYAAVAGWYIVATHGSNQKDLWRVLYYARRAEGFGEEKSFPSKLKVKTRRGFENALEKNSWDLALVYGKCANMLIQSSVLLLFWGVVAVLLLLKTLSFNCRWSEITVVVFRGCAP